MKLHALRRLRIIHSRPFLRTVCVSVVIFAGCSDGPTEPRPVEWGAWSSPVLAPAVNSSDNDQQPVLSPDNLSLYFGSRRAGGLGGNDIWVSRRASINSEWQTPVNVGAPVNSAGDDQSPAFSTTGHLLFFQSARPGGFGQQDVYVSRRSNVADDRAWGLAINLGAQVNTSVYEAGPMYLEIEGAPTSLYFARGPTPSDVEMYSVPIDSNGLPRGSAQPLVELNFPNPLGTDAHPTVSMDGKELIFFSDRPGGFGLADLYVSTRQDVTSGWGPPQNMGPTLNTQFRDAQPSLSFDGATLVFASDRPGGQGSTDIYFATRARR
ncbi:MAG TPA: hypothetical protein VNJ04_10250 [Gemmatimonadaceae bacterium]|nr:hypothetical protein [Gemmatimonadaceae bacterium]